MISFTFNKLITDQSAFDPELYIESLKSTITRIFHAVKSLTREDLSNFGFLNDALDLCVTLIERLENAI